MTIGGWLHFLKITIMQSKIKKTIIETDDAPTAIGAYNQGVIVGNLLFISGQIAIDPSTGYMVTNNIKMETKRVMKNIKAILKKAGCTFEEVVKCSVFVKDISQFQAINKVYAKYFDAKTAPAREFVEVSKLPRNVNIEISAIALVKPKSNNA